MQYRQIHNTKPNKFSQVQSTSATSSAIREDTVFLYTGKKDSTQQTRSASKFSPTSLLSRSKKAISSVRELKSIIKPCLQALLY